MTLYQTFQMQQESFKKLEKVTEDFTAPVGSCITFQRTYKLIDALEKDIFKHIHLENCVIFKMM